MKELTIAGCKVEIVETFGESSRFKVKAARAAGYVLRSSVEDVFKVGLQQSVHSVS